MKFDALEIEQLELIRVLCRRATERDEARARLLAVLMERATGGLFAWLSFRPPGARE